MNKFGGRHGCDELISVGEAPFVVLWKHGKPVVYSNGLQLKNKMSDDLTFVETIRIREGTIEYCFSIDGIESKWSSSRQTAFLECVEKAKKTLPAKRCVILGPSQEAVQKAILAKYPHILSSLDEPLSEAAPSTQITPKKTVSWGDEMDKVVEEPDTEHRYGGWGLLAYKTIPNREELLAQMRTWSDLVMDSEDIDEFASLDDDEAELMFSNEMRSYSIFEDEPLIGSPTLTAHKRPVLDDDKTVYNGSGDDETEDGDADNEEEVKEQTSPVTKRIDIREPVTEESSNDSDSSEDTTDEDEEGGASRSDVSQLRKRIRVSPSSAHQEKRFDSNNSVCLSVDTSQEASRPTLNSPITCKPVEDGLKECDFLWLNDQIF